MKVNENILKKLEIVRALSYVPNDRLDEVESFIKFVLSQSNGNRVQKREEPETLAGIWKGKGFEKIADFDTEIKHIRKELSSKILQRHK